MLRLLVVLLLLTAAPAMAQQIEDRLADPAQEMRARELSRELRCLVCQNQSIEDSNAPLARDLRRIVRERVVAGDSDRAVQDYLVQRYGEWVLLKPRFNAQTFLLWLGPVLLLLLGGGIVFALYRRQARAQVVAPVALDADEQRRLDTLLRDDEVGK
ncbi:cytochrome c-type biogenesis protein CcmH [Ferrovibrio terrae]|uniref:Cytochrome c-type biogenesis protein n=1 Tax=Ferrovibrio terrae TaxID=2594003 RepID=A0A516H1W6_9PROT|nr:cytochrome c-type biogenesis protein [Ferrovibrio terrae]QDO97745.1 cytochrome c-type biogenesis protein CcmH [Ferrovibrio terrae]